MKIYFNIFPERSHIPGDEHFAAIEMTVPLIACRSSVLAQNCVLNPAGGSFSTDRLGDQFDVKVQYLDLERQGNSVRLTVSLIRNGRAAADVLEFPTSACK